MPAYKEKLTKWKRLLNIIVLWVGREQVGVKGEIQEFSGNRMSAKLWRAIHGVLYSKEWTDAKLHGII